MATWKILISFIVVPLVHLLYTLVSGGSAARILYYSGCLHVHVFG